MKKIACMAAIACLFVGAREAAAGTIVGVNDNGNCYPFSCAASDGVVTYQQVYSAAAFGGPLSFDSISFFKSTGTDMDTADYAIYFSTTSMPVLGLDGNPANNLGADNALFGNFTIGGAMPNVLTLVGNTFNYDPSDGNLLMTVYISNLTTNNGYESFFQADYTGVQTSRLYATDSSVTQNATGALVTEFSLSAVPEPSSMAMAGIAAVAGLGLASRRRVQA